MHHYSIRLDWTGNRGAGTTGYRDYDRDHEISAPGRPTITGSADPAFRGDATRWSPEDLLVAALSQCHLLWYLHLAAVAGVIVHAYSDDAEGTLELGRDGSGRFSEVVLRPRVTVAEPAMRERALALHADAHAACFIARSVNFPVRHEPVIGVSVDVRAVTDADADAGTVGAGD